MVHPFLTLLVAASVQVSADLPAPAPLEMVVLRAAQAVEAARDALVPDAEEPTPCDVPYYYDDLAPVPAPVVAPRVTYDWRSPIVFDLP